MLLTGAQQALRAICRCETLRRASPFLASLLLLLAQSPFTGSSAVFHPSVPGTNSVMTNTAEAILQEMLKVTPTGSNTYRLGLVVFDKAQRTLSIPGRVRMRKDVVEYALVTEQGKGYESLLTTEAKPFDIQVACLLLGQAQVPLTGDFNQDSVVPETNAVAVEVAWKTNGASVRFPLAELVCVTSGRPDPSAPAMKVTQWLYNGSFIDRAGFAAQREGSIISLIRDPVALVNNPGADRDNDDIHFPNTRLLPADGTEVQVVFRFTSGRLK